MKISLQIKNAHSLAHPLKPLAMLHRNPYNQRPKQHVYLIQQWFVITVCVGGGLGGTEANSLILDI